MSKEHPTDLDHLTTAILQAIGEHKIPVEFDLNGEVDPLTFTRLQKDKQLIAASTVVTNKIIRVGNLMNLGKVFEITPSSKLELGQIRIISVMAEKAITFSMPLTVLPGPRKGWWCDDDR